MSIAARPLSHDFIQPVLGDGESRPAAPRRRAPLLIDLDHALLKTDLLLECFAAAVKRKPLVLLLTIWWLLQGREVLAQKLAKAANFDGALLPIDQALADYAAEQAASGRQILLVSAANEFLARRVALRFPFSLRLLPIDSARPVGAQLQALFPEGFVYAGGAGTPFDVWHAAQGHVLVRPDARTETLACARFEPEHRIADGPAGLALYLKAARLKQWSKNALVLAPLALAGRLLDPGAWWLALLAFLALGLTASATYLINDLLDLTDDRQHWTKRNRPLASGALPIGQALALSPVLLFVGLALAAMTDWAVLCALLLYVGLTLTYSFVLKRIPIVDVMALASLFTLRLGIGVAAVAVPVSPWLFVFSMALFLSLSLAKRHTELTRAPERGGPISSRGYVARDEPLLLALGLTTACSSIILLSLYMANEAFRVGSYGAPLFLWACPGILFLWLGRIWLLSQRGVLDDDPVAFALRDRISLTLGALMIMAFLAATFLPIRF